MYKDYQAEAAFFLELINRVAKLITPRKSWICLKPILFAGRYRYTSF